MTVDMFVALRSLAKRQLSVVVIVVVIVGRSILPLSSCDDRDHGIVAGSSEMATKTLSPTMTLRGVVRRARGGLAAGFPGVLERVRFVTRANTPQRAT